MRALRRVGLFNKTVPIDVIALLRCTRSSLGICASSSGAVAGLLLWKVTPQNLALSDYVYYKYENLMRYKTELCVYDMLSLKHFITRPFRASTHTLDTLLITLIKELQTKCFLPQCIYGHNIILFFYLGSRL